MYNFPTFNRYKKNFNSWKTRGLHRPANTRQRCSDCGGQFYEQTQATPMDMHCFKASGGKHGGPEYLHHSWQGATTTKPNSPKFVIKSDAVAYWRNDLEEN